MGFDPKSANREIAVAYILGERLDLTRKERSMRHLTQHRRLFAVIVALAIAVAVTLIVLYSGGGGGGAGGGGY
jgi:hypothetical protein